MPLESQLLASVGQHFPVEPLRTLDAIDIVELVHGDALSLLTNCKGIGFCFLDAEKEVYGSCYEAVVPCLAKGGLLVADNAISHQATLQPLLERALRDARVDAIIVPIGNGELICRKR